MIRNKRFISSVMGFMLMISSIPGVSLKACGEKDDYPYTIFASSNSDGAITINSNNICINGNIATNGTIVVNGNCNFNGEKKEKVNESMDDITDELEQQYFSDKIHFNYTSDYKGEYDVTMLYMPVEINGSVQIEGNVNLNTAFLADEDISLKGDVYNWNDSVVISKTGDISIESQVANLNGLIYAPYGTVDIKANNITMNNVVIIAEKVNINSYNYNANYSSIIAKFIGKWFKKEKKKLEETNENQENKQDSSESEKKDEQEKIKNDNGQEKTNENPGNKQDTLDNNKKDEQEELILEGEESFKDKYLILSGKYDEYSDSLELMWFSNVHNKEIEICSSTNGEKYDIIDYITEDYYEYNIEDDLKKKYFKVRLKENGKTVVESDPICVKTSGDKYIIKYCDYDNDGLQDSHEKVCGTDYKNQDSDGDNLTDGFEVVESFTNPNSIDTDENLVNDDLEDFDEDGLNNYTEMTLGTNPYLNDSDEDGVLDGEEVIKYGIDPLNPDTDFDNILDIDEVNFGMDPKDATDAEKSVHQVLEVEDLDINNYNTEFSITMDVEASNNVKRYLKQDASSYSVLLKNNSSIIGTPIYINYEAGKIYEGTIKFKLDDTLIQNSHSYYTGVELGIKRYGIFAYDDGVKTIVPIECIYNSDDNSLTIDASIMGDLMLVDCEALANDLGISYDQIKKVINENENDNNDSKDLNKNSNRGGSKPSNGFFYVTAEDMKEIELVIVIDTTSSMEKKLPSIKKQLNKLIKKLQDNGIYLYTTIITYGDTKYGEKTLLNNMDPELVESNKYFNKDLQTIQNIINNIKKYDGGNDELETPIDALGLATTLPYKINPEKYLFLITDIGYKITNDYGYSSLADVSMDLYKDNIYASIVTKDDLFSEYKKMTSTTGGIEIEIDDDICNEMYDFMTRNTSRTKVVVSDYLATGCFKEELKKGGLCDTDGDGLTDSQEVDWKNIKVKNGEIQYISWGELCKKSKYKKGKNNVLFEAMQYTSVIPAKTNPFDKDSDGDYYLDGEDKNPLKMDSMYINDAGIDDREFRLNDTDITKKESKKKTDGKLIISNTNRTAKYEFIRASNIDYYFDLKPIANSFYKFENDALKMNIVEVTHEKGLVFKEKVIDQPDEDGSYLLKKGVNYKIRVRGYNKGDYKFSVQQDNWIKLDEDGGLVTGTETRYVTRYNEIYLSANAISALTRLDIENNTLSDPYFKNRLMNAIKDCMFISQNDGLKPKMDFTSILATFVGVAITVIDSKASIWINMGKTVAFTGGYSTYISLAIDIINDKVMEDFMDTLDDALGDDNYNLMLTIFYPYAPGDICNDCIVYWEKWENMYRYKFDNYSGNPIRYDSGVMIEEIISCI